MTSTPAARSSARWAHLALVLLQLAEMAAAQTPSCTMITLSSDVCKVQDMCGRCVRAEGCAFDTLKRVCVDAPIDRPLYESSMNSLLNRTRIAYCPNDDLLCAQCRPTASTYCEGTNACVCRSICDMVRPAQLACYQQNQISIFYVSLMAIAVLLPFSVWLQRHCLRGRAGVDTSAGLRVVPRRAPWRTLVGSHPPPGRRQSTPALQLDAWRSHRDEHKIAMDHIELRACYVLMTNDHVGDDDDARVAPPSSGASSSTLSPPSTPMARPTWTMPLGQQADRDESKDDDAPRTHPVPS